MSDSNVKWLIGGTVFMVVFITIIWKLSSREVPVAPETPEQKREKEVIEKTKIEARAEQLAAENKKTAAELSELKPKLEAAETKLRVAEAKIAELQKAVAEADANAQRRVRAKEDDLAQKEQKMKVVEAVLEQRIKDFNEKEAEFKKWKGFVDYDYGWFMTRTEAVIESNLSPKRALFLDKMEFRRKKMEADLAAGFRSYSQRLNKAGESYGSPTAIVMQKEYGPEYKDSVRASFQKDMDAFLNSEARMKRAYMKEADFLVSSALRKRDPDMPFRIGIEIGRLTERTCK